MSNAKVLKDILDLALSELKENGSIGYTMPDGKYHIFISIDETSDGHFYFIEPNRIVDGAAEPMGDTTTANMYDFSGLLLGCAWCIDCFEEDKRSIEKSISGISDYDTLKNKILQEYREGDVELAELVSAVASGLSIEDTFKLYAELRQEIDGDKVIYLKSSGEIYDIGAEDVLTGSELKAIVSDFIGREASTIKLDLGLATLVADKSADPDFDEVFIGLEDKNGRWLQDLVIVAPQYHYDKGDIQYENAVTIKVFNDVQSEDYTHVFSVPMYEPEEELVSDDKPSLDAQIKAANDIKDGKASNDKTAEKTAER